MPRLPITEDRGAAGDQAAGGSGVSLDSSDYDEMLGVHTLFVVVPRAEVVYFRLVVESWEDIAVVRTMQRFCEDDRTRSVVVVMAVPDYIEPCLSGLARLCVEVDGVRVPVTSALRDSLRGDLLDVDASGNDASGRPIV